MEIQFHRRRKDGRARLAIVLWDAAGMPVTFCIPVTALKLTRYKATLQLFRQDRETQQYELWAALNFVDYESTIISTTLMN
jgi:hypothetical protein